MFEFPTKSLFYDDVFNISWVFDDDTPMELNSEHVALLSQIQETCPLKYEIFKMFALMRYEIC